MSGACPKCSAAVDTTFGLKNCPSCNTLLYVDFDGNIEMSNPLETSPTEETAATEAATEAAIELAAELASEAATEVVPPQVTWPEVEPLQSQAPQDFAATVESVQDFANSEMSQGQEGRYIFDIRISGIDSAKVRNDLKDALTDRRFVWEVESLLKSIHQGELVVRGLSPVKASVLIHRLKELPLVLTWASRVQ